MKHYTFAAYGAYSRCDDPVQPDGTWQRRMDYETLSANRPFTGASSAAP